MLSLSAPLTAALTRLGREQGLTLNTVMQAALGDPAGAADRPRRRGVRRDGGGAAAGDRRHRAHGGAVHQHAAAAGAAAAGKPLLELLARGAGAASPRLMAHQHLGLAEIQALAGLGELFDTLVVFENYPVDRRSWPRPAGDLRLGRVSGHDATHYPLSLMAVPGERLRLRLDYRPDLFDRAGIEAIAARLVRLLEAVVADPDRAIGTPRHPRARRTPHDPARVERHRARDRARHPAGAVRRAGGAHARCGRGGVRGSAAHLRRARCARQSAGASAARAGRRARTSWWDYASSVRSRWSSDCWRCSRRAAPMFRSIPNIRPSACAYMLADAKLAVLLTHSSARARPYRSRTGLRCILLDHRRT